MPHAFPLFQRGLGCQLLPIDRAFSGIGIHSEIPDLKCGEILEEVTALRRRDPEVAEARFHNGAGA